MNNYILAGLQRGSGFHSDQKITNNLSRRLSFTIVSSLLKKYKQIIVLATTPADVSADVSVNDTSFLKFTI